MTAKTIMIMGTGSDVGKSLIVAGLCRHFANRGLCVAPFKPQNMSNNAAVTADGGEIGRAQALQARAARCALTTDLNPVLLKPQSETGAQIVVQGKLVGSARAREFQDRKRALMPAVLESFERLRAAHDIVIVEGAGSASEVNLRANDIANMGFAEAADVPVVLLGDIDRGGVIASVVGTKAVLSAADAARIEGFIVNKMRGDPTLFADGMTAIATYTGWAGLGLVPYFPNAHKLPPEDAWGLSQRKTFNVDHALHESTLSIPTRAQRSLWERVGARGINAHIKIAVPLLPHISNFDDLDPLRLEPNVSVEMIQRDRPLPADADVIVLSGSKSTIADLEAFRAAGFDIDLAAHVRRGGHVLGLCGGFQMLGRTVADPDGVEGSPRTVAGLGFLDVDTVLTGEKILRHVRGQIHPMSWPGSPRPSSAIGELVDISLDGPVEPSHDVKKEDVKNENARDDGVAFEGYEMHMGQTAGEGLARPFLQFDDGRADGAVSANGRIGGCYVHGLFVSDSFRKCWLALLGGNAASDFSYDAMVEDTLDELAAHLAAHIDMDALAALMR